MAIYNGQIQEDEKRKQKFIDIKEAFESGLAQTRTDSIISYLNLTKYAAMEEENPEKTLTFVQQLASLSAPDDYHRHITVGYWTANAYSKLENYEAAQKWVDYMIKHGEQATFKTRGDEANYYDRLSNICAHTHQFDEAIQYGEKGIEILGGFEEQYKEVAANLYVGVGDLYNQVASIHEKDTYMEGYERKVKVNIVDYKKKSFQRLKESLRFSENFIIYYRLSSYSMSQNKFDEAISYLQKSMVLYIPNFNPKTDEDNPTVDLLNKSGYAAEPIFSVKGYLLMLKYVNTPDLNQVEKIKLLQQVLDIHETCIAFRDEKLSSLDGYEKSLFAYNKKSILYYGYARLALYELYQIEPSKALFDRIFYYNEKRKVMSLVETLTPSKLPPEITEEHLALKQDLLQTQQKLDLASQDSLLFYQNKLAANQQAMESHKRMIQEKYPKEANNFYHIDYATADDIAAELNEQTLFISVDVQYFGEVGETFNMVAIDKNKKKAYQVLQDTVFRHIWNLEKMQKNPLLVQKKKRDLFINYCHRLYGFIIEPMEDMLAGKTKIILVQEGHVLRIPFDILLASGEKKPFHELDFLIKKYDITYHYSATAYLQLKQRTTVKDNSLLAFAPVFEQKQSSLATTAMRDFFIDSLHRSVEGERFIPLPYTKKEVKTIAQSLEKLGDTQVFMEEKATKKNLLTALEAKPYQFIHIATHGLVNMDNHRLSGIACSHQDEKEEALLFANEIQQLDINADLVILSSCESGVGMVIRGEGLIAINRAFFYAGAKNIIFSLWKVNDEYTSELMIDFYQNYLATKDYSQSLRQAKLKMLDNPTTANPRFWAPFVLIGE